MDSEYFIRDGYLVNNINENYSATVDEAIASANYHYNIDLSILSDLTLDGHGTDVTTTWKTLLLVRRYKCNIRRTWFFFFFHCNPTLRPAVV